MEKETIGKKILGYFILFACAFFAIGIGATVMSEKNQIRDAKNYIFHPTDFYFTSNLILMSCLVIPLVIYIIYKANKKEK